jgi:hypothetical protein
MGNRLSSAICSPSCSSMYSRIISSVMVPERTARYPRAHKCRPQNFLRKCANSWSNTRELIPFNYCTIGLTS